MTQFTDDAPDRVEDQEPLIANELLEKEPEEEVDLLEVLLEDAQRNLHLRAWIEDFSSTVAYVAIWWRTHCRCGAISESFEGLFEERIRVRSRAKKMVRLSAPPCDDSPLPRYREYLEQHVPYCAACISAQNYRDR